MKVIPLPSSTWAEACVARIGVAPLTRMAFDGVDLYPMWTEMMGRATDDAAGAGIGMDLAAIAQLRGDKPTGLAIQRESLDLHQVFCAADAPDTPSLRVLAFAAASDIGANTPLDFLVRGQSVSVATLYLGRDVPIPERIPVHDIGMVVAPASEDGAYALELVERIASKWPVPILNTPARIRNLERDLLYRQLHDIAGIAIPQTLRLDREELSGDLPLGYPMIIRPIGSHAGFGLAKLECARDLKTYLGQRGEDCFFVSPYIDYASADGLFRKYRIAIIGGRPTPIHMAIADEWKVWYLNADMASSVPHRIEEARFLEFFEEEFATGHEDALAALSRRIGLDYVLVDCAETRDGRLLIFEADHCCIVHDMDPISVYPYKLAAMSKLFEAFCAMLRCKAAVQVSCPFVLV